MDFDAGRVLSGELTLGQAAEELGELVLAVVQGAATKSEELGHREYFIMYKHQHAPSLLEGCRA